MIQSHLFGKTLREDPKDEISANAKFLERGGFVTKTMAGVYTYLPLGFRVLKKIEEVIRHEMVHAGGQELLMPVLQPKENWQKTGRWDTYDTLFKFASFYSKGEFALGPTHEEIISPLVGMHPLSYRDLPLYLFQIQTKFRDEKRAKSGILRGREFLMKDFYSFHADDIDAAQYYEKMKTHYAHIFDAAGIGKETYLTFASGGSFSKYSHEFQTTTDAGEDTIFLCESCRVAVNSEIIEEQKSCPDCGNVTLEEKKAIEVGNIFPLKTKYSKPFDLAYLDDKGGRHDVVMGCYGIGVGRLMGAVVEVHHDARGIVWPVSIAPYRVHLVELKTKNLEAGGMVQRAAEKLYEELLAEGVEVLYDDRDEKTAGEKFADADLIGIPWRVVVSEKTVAENKLEMKERRKDKIEMMDKNIFLKIVIKGQPMQ